MTQEEKDLFGDLDFGDPANPAPPANTPTPGQPGGSAPFLRAGSTVYNSEADAVDGTLHKDQVISTLRKRIIEKEGIDPLTNRPVPRPTSPTYTPNDPGSYFNEIVAAAEQAAAGRPDAYKDVQQRLILETIGPAMPILLDSAKDRAIREVEVRYPSIREFLVSPDFQAVRNTIPLLGEAIDTAEANVTAAAQLPGLYTTAYLTSLGMKGAVSQTPHPSARPTLTPGTSAVPTPTPAIDINDMSTAAKRKAVIEYLEGKGIRNVPLSKLA